LFPPTGVPTRLPNQDQKKASQLRLFSSDMVRKDSEMTNIGNDPEQSKVERLFDNSFLFDSNKNTFIHQDSYAAKKSGKGNGKRNESWQNVKRRIGRVLREENTSETHIGDES
jgi:hypothetical protein